MFFNKNKRSSRKQSLRTTAAANKERSSSMKAQTPADAHQDASLVQLVEKYLAKAEKHRNRGNLDSALAYYHRANHLQAPGSAERAVTQTAIASVFRALEQQQREHHHHDSSSSCMMMVDDSSTAFTAASSTQDESMDVDSLQRHRSENWSANDDTAVLSLRGVGRHASCSQFGLEPHGRMQRRRGVYPVRKTC